MKINNPIKGTLIKRYKRFFSDVLLESGEVVTAHTPNTGPMTTCWEAGMSCILSSSDNPNRKLKYTLELTNNNKSYILVNTHLPNKIVEESLLNKELPFKFNKIEREFSIGNSRFDFYLENKNIKKIIEVKNVSTIDSDDIAIFPDTPSERALKHVNEMIKLQKKGYKCILLFFVGREDVKQFRPAKEIHSEYFKAVKKAYENGVEIRAFQYKISPNDISFKKELKVMI